MSIHANAHKAPGEILHHGIGSISVTKTLASEPRKKRKRSDRPRQEAQRLTPWLAIANGTAKPPIKLGEVLFPLTPPSFELLQRNVQSSFGQIAAYAEDLRTGAPGFLERYRSSGAYWASEPLIEWNAEDTRFSPGLVLGRDDGRFRLNAPNLVTLFIKALVGTEAWRFNRCPICKRFFYAARSDQKACSKRCNGTLRAALWRHNEEERTSRVAMMLREGRAIKQIKEIAGALAVDDVRVRRYVRKARERAKKERERMTSKPG